jgi:hypothetical protein
MDYLAELRATIRRLHRCEVSHTRTERVREAINGRVLWEGPVEVFALAGHDHALRCYAWGHLNESQQWEVTTVLAIPPVISASSAVVAAFVARLKRNEHERSGEPE